MSAIASAMGVARSHLYERTKGSGPVRGPYRKAGDADLLSTNGRPTATAGSPRLFAANWPRTTSPWRTTSGSTG